MVGKAKKLDGQSTFKGAGRREKGLIWVKRRTLEIVDTQETFVVQLRPFDMSRLFFVSLVFTSYAKARSQVT